jgi:hypothetical protein
MKIKDITYLDFDRVKQEWQIKSLNLVADVYILRNHDAYGFIEIYGQQVYNYDVIFNIDMFGGLNITVTDEGGLFVLVGREFVIEQVNHIKNNYFNLSFLEQKKEEIMKYKEKSKKPHDYCIRLGSIFQFLPKETVDKIFKKL